MKYIVLLFLFSCATYLSTVFLIAMVAAATIVIIIKCFDWLFMLIEELLKDPRK